MASLERLSITKTKVEQRSTTGGTRPRAASEGTVRASLGKQKFDRVYRQLQTPLIVLVTLLG